MFEDYLEEFWNEIEAAGEELRSKPMPKLREEDFFLFKETGNRLVYEGEYFGRRRYLTVYGILAEFGENPQDMEKLEEVINEVCMEGFWALPAHVNFEDLDTNCIDLFASETAGTLAEMAYIFKDRLSKSTMENMIHNVLARVIEPFATSTVPYSWWEEDRCNWSAVCGGNIGIAAIYLHKLGKIHQDWYDNIIKRVQDSLECYIAGFEEDGTCSEGLGYFSYGMSYYTAFAELLDETTEGKTNLMANPKVEEIASFQHKCYFAGGVTVNFSDASTHESFLPGLTAYLAQSYDRVEIPDISAARHFEEDNCYRWVTNERNIRWLAKYPPKKAKATNPEKYQILPSAQWLIYKDESGMGYAAKGGNNDENHNHNDVGSFMVVHNGDVLLADLGAGEYTKEYFSEGRYNILCNRSLGHSVPLINDMEQCAGAKYRADRFTWNEEEESLEISFASAYPEKIVENITRRIEVVDNSINITDTFITTQNTRKITENLVSFYKPDVEGNTVYIHGKTAFCHIDIKGNTVKNVEVIPKEHYTHDGKLTTVYLIQWEIKVSNSEDLSTNMCIKCEKL